MHSVDRTIVVHAAVERELCCGDLAIRWELVLESFSEAVDRSQLVDFSRICAKDTVESLLSADFRSVSDTETDGRSAPVAQGLRLNRPDG